MFWKNDIDFNARIIEDNPDTEFIPEEQILWGTQAEQITDDFTLVSDGSQGLRHAVPLTNIDFNRNQQLYRPLRLVVRHYIDCDETTGLARIYLSRLVSVKSRKVIDAKTYS